MKEFKQVRLRKQKRKINPFQENQVIQMEKQNKFDVIIIGGGQAGYLTAIQASRKGLKTALIEKNRIGGNYFFKGLLPIRSLLESACLFEKVRNAKEFGVKCGAATPDWQTITLRTTTIAAK